MSGSTPVGLRGTPPLIIEGDQLDSRVAALPAVLEALAATDEETR